MGYPGLIYVNGVNALDLFSFLTGEKERLVIKIGHKTVELVKIIDYRFSELKIFILSTHLSSSKIEQGTEMDMSMLELLTNGKGLTGEEKEVRFTVGLVEVNAKSSQNETFFLSLVKDSKGRKRVAMEYDLLAPD